MKSFPSNATILSYVSDSTHEIPPNFHTPYASPNVIKLNEEQHTQNHAEGQSLELQTDSTSASPQIANSSLSSFSYSEPSLSKDSSPSSHLFSDSSLSSISPTSNQLPNSSSTKRSLDSFTSNTEAEENQHLKMSMNNTGDLHDPQALPATAQENVLEQPTKKVKTYSDTPNEAISTSANISLYSTSASPSASPNPYYQEISNITPQLAPDISKEAHTTIENLEVPQISSRQLSSNAPVSDDSSIEAANHQTSSEHQADGQIDDFSGNTFYDSNYNLTPTEVNNLQSSTNQEGEFYGDNTESQFNAVISTIKDNDPQEDLASQTLQNIESQQAISPAENFPINNAEENSAPKTEGGSQVIPFNQVESSTEVSETFSQTGVVSSSNLSMAVPSGAISQGEGIPVQAAAPGLIDFTAGQNAVVNSSTSPGEVDSTVYNAPAVGDPVYTQAIPIAGAFYTPEVVGANQAIPDPQPQQPNYIVPLQFGGQFGDFMATTQPQPAPISFTHMTVPIGYLPQPNYFANTTPNPDEYAQQPMHAFALPYDAAAYNPDGLQIDPYALASVYTPYYNSHTQQPSAEYYNTSNYYTPSDPTNNTQQTVYNNYAPAHVNRKMGFRFFVGGLLPDLFEQEMVDYFSAFGTVCEARITKDYYTGQSRGFGFVSVTDEAAKKLIFQQGYHEIRGKRVDVREESHSMPNDTNRKIFVGGLDANWTELDLTKYFNTFGPVEHTHIVTDFTGKSRCFGFVTFADEPTTQTVIQHPAHKIMERSIEIRKAEPKRQKVTHKSPQAYQNWSN